MNPESKSKSIRVAMIGSWGSIHPALQSNFVASQILQNQFEPLVGKGDHGEWVPGAARSWTTSPDGRAVEFAIDTTRRFSDGSHLKAGDFKRSWEDALKVHKDSSQSSLREVLSQVVGFEEFPVTGRLSGVTAPSKDVLRVQFKTSFRMAIEQLHGARYGAYKSNESDGPVIGTGRYVMTESGAGQLNLEPNPHHPDFAKLRSLQVVAISASEVPSGLASGKWDCVFNTTGSWLSPEAFSVAGVEALRGEEAMHSVLHVNGTSTRLIVTLDASRRAIDFLCAHGGSFVRRKYELLRCRSPDLPKRCAGRLSDATVAEVYGEVLTHPELVARSKAEPLVLFWIRRQTTSWSKFCATPGECVCAVSQNRKRLRGTFPHKR